MLGVWARYSGGAIFIHASDFILSASAVVVEEMEVGYLWDRLGSLIGFVAGCDLNHQRGQRCRCNPNQGHPPQT